MIASFPSLPPAFIPRPRLHHDLVRWRTLRLISIVAPTGYGKSTLAAAWLDELSAQPAVEQPIVAWLSLEPAGIPADLLLHQLVMPLLPHLPSLQNVLEGHASGRQSIAQVAKVLCLQIGQLSHRFVFVLDDFHLLSDTDALHLIQHILDAGPPNLHLFLISRTQPSLKFGRLLLRNAALLLDQEALRFDHDEFLAFARATSLADLDGARLATIEARCQGWVAALRLLTLSLPTSSTDTIDALLGQRFGQLLLEHLEAEVFLHLPNELQRFLVDVASLPFLTPQFIAATAPYDVWTAENLLQQALDANIFLTSYTHLAMDGTTQTRWRFHPLLRELLLRKQIKRSDSSAVQHTIRRAADWLAADGAVDAALDLLLPHLPADAAAAVVAAHLRPAILRFELVAARRWLERLPAALIDAHPRLAVDAAWLALFAERSDFPSCIARAQAALAAVDQHSPDELHAEIGTLHALSLYADLRVDAARAVAEDARRQPHTASGLAAGYLHLLDALLRNRPEDLAARLRSVHLAADIFRRLGFAHAAVDAALWPCVLKRRYGDAHGAVAAFENALAVMHHFGREHGTVAADVHNHYGEHLYYMDRIADARAQFQRARAVAARIAPTGIAVYQASLGLQLCSLAEGRTTAEFMADFDPVDDARCWTATLTDNIPLIAVSAGWLRLLRDLRLGALDRCRQTADSFGLSPNQLTPEIHELLRLLVLGGAVVGGSTAPALGPVLRTLQAEMHEVENVPVSLYSGALLVSYLLRCNDVAGARTVARTLVPLFRRSGMPRLLADFPQALHLVEHIEATSGDASDRFDLSRQELRILQILANEASNKEIAAAFSVSLPTVKTHLRHIYRKLGVHSRAEAVRVARAMGIGDPKIKSSRVRCQ